jgi:hypothetical protein
MHHENLAALRMNVLLGISPRALSVCFTSTIGKVIPTFSVLSSRVVRLILVSYIVPLELYTYRFPVAISVFMNF